MRPTAPTLAASLLLALAVACGGGGGGGTGNPGGAGGSGGGNGGGGGGGSGGAGLPAIDSLEPDHGMIGAHLQIHGRSFAQPAGANEVYFNGQVSVALSVDAAGTVIETAVPQNATTGPVKLMVNQVVVDGPVFTVDPYPAPHLASLSPDRVAVGEAANLVLTGTDFRPVAKVLLDGVPITANYVSATRFELTVAGSVLAREETHTLQVAIDPPGGGRSETVEFEVVRRFRLLGAEATGATALDVRFEEALADPADVSIYSLDPALAVQSAAADATDHRLVHLVTAPQNVGTRYALGVQPNFLSEQGRLLAAGEVSFLAFGSPPEPGVPLAASGCDGFSASGPGALSPAAPSGFYLTERTGHQLQILDAYGSGRGYLGDDGTGARRHDGTGANALGCPGEDGSSGPGGFRLPRGAVARLSGGDLLVGDTGNARVQRWSSSGAYRGTFGSDFTSPVVLGVVANLVWIADADDRVHLYNAAGEAQGVATGAAESLGAYAFGIAAGETPVLAAADGVAYLAEPGNHRVIALANGVGTGYLGGGVAGFRNDGPCCSAGTAAAAFDTPKGVAVDSDGRILVVDAANGGRLQRFTPDGQPDYEMPLEFVPGGIAVGQSDLGDFWLISDPAGDKVHLYQP
jgi:hypothetical protein